MHRNTFTTIIGVLIVLILAVVTWSYSQYTTGEGDRAEISDAPLDSGSPAQEVFGITEVEIIQSKSKFEFEGFNIARSHVATFDEWEGVLLVEDGEVVGGRGTIQAASVNTGISRLDSHLKSDDFFEVEKYPEISFEVTGVGEGQISGKLTFRGVTKEVSLPVNTSQNSISTEFFLDTTPFNFKYTGVNPEVRIAFEFVY